MKDPFPAPDLASTPSVIPPSCHSQRSEAESRNLPPTRHSSALLFSNENTPNSINLRHKINQTRPYSITKSNQLQARTPGNE